ncbi:MAG TPA: DinB family protein [Candidatus Limnocylindria bacterium]|nr:DinB family protein [Candidatus Limnocylindria bacterium]
MNATRYYLPEFDQEMATTHRVLERVPEDKLDWKPHAKSMSLGQLASHVAQLPDWVSNIFSADEFDFRPPDGPAYAQADCKTSQELLALFDRSVLTARKAIAAATEAGLDAPWTLKAGDFTAFTAPRWSVFRGFGMNHIVHHRAQLSVYLRLLDVPVPVIYGPTADEQ